MCYCIIINYYLPYLSLSITYLNIHILALITLYKFHLLHNLSSCAVMLESCSYVVSSPTIRFAKKKEKINDKVQKVPHWRQMATCLFSFHFALSYIKTL